jgi:hypothetical protein
VRIAAHQSANGLHAKADIGGELVVRVLGRRGEHLLLSVQLKNVDRHGYQMFDQDWLENPDAAKQQLEGRELVVEVARHGRLVRVHRKADEDKLFASILQSVLLRAQFSLPKTAAVTWNGVESTTTGVSNVVYEVTSQQPLVLRRTRTHYDTIQGLPPMPSSQERQQLEASASIELDRDGVPTHFRDKEKLAVFKGNSAEAMLESSSDLELTKMAEEPMQGEPEIALSGWIEQSPTEWMDNQAEAERKLLEQRIGGMTLQEMVDGIELLAAAGLMPDQARWMSRATGLLRLHPAYCHSLAAVFEQELMTTEGRAFILDLLALVGHPEAQAAMRDALSSEAARLDDDAYSLLVQRLVFVGNPTSETLTFLASKVEELKGEGGDDLHAYANALASAAGQARRQGLSEAAAAGQKVVDLLQAAREPQDQKAFLAALGNASMPEHEPVIRSYAENSEPMVRSAAAYALRRAQDDASRRTLMDLAQDQQRMVVESALAALDEQPLGREELERLATMVVSGQTSLSSDSHMATLLGRHAGSSERVQQALVFLLARNQDNPQVASKIVMALRGAAT